MAEAVMKSAGACQRMALSVQLLFGHQAIWRVTAIVATAGWGSSDVITQAGYDAIVLHRLGHGLGSDVHEPRKVAAHSDPVLAERMSF
ncbi:MULTISPECIES: M24 family metallopeptidase [unclassified Sulfitobacter]|uniref:M24 family metallopeptidase n=1 Tax=unclassified Sulfitobacter TaxID=196795 RepID=UPI00123764CB|nr:MULTISPECIES: M24 family metallopeptidase [unclassified Sulfitobacter]